MDRFGSGQPSLERAYYPEQSPGSSTLTRKLMLKYNNTGASRTGQQRALEHTLQRTTPPTFPGPHPGLCTRQPEQNSTGVLALL